MNRLAEEFAPRKVGSVFLYTNEAHPGEHYPHHESIEQKLTHARALRDRLGVSRPILVDTLDGACHRRYGSMPNMTWIFDRRGTVLYKADWTDTGSVRAMLETLPGLSAQRRGGAQRSPFRVERVEWREADRKRFFDGLELAGPKAVEEFKKAWD